MKVLFTEFYRIYNVLVKTARSIDVFFILAIIWISIDGFPYIPINTNNRPVSIIFILLYWCLHKAKYPKLIKFEIYALLTFLIGITFTAFRSLVSFNDARPLLKFLITGTLSYITITSCYLFFLKYTKDKSTKDLLLLITYVFILSSIIPLLIGFLQLVSINIVSSRPFLSPIFNFFSNDVDIYNTGRLILISNEPAQAGTYLLYIFCFVWSFYDYNKFFKKIYLSILIIFLIFINSSVTYIIFALLLFFNWLILTKKNIGQILKFTSITLTVCIISYYMSIYLLTDYTARRLTQLLELITDINADTWILIASNDFSILDRFGTPIFGFISLKYTNFIGTGGEGFFLVYEKLIFDLFPELINNSYLSKFFLEDIQMTVKFLPAKIAAEFGIIGLFLYCFSTFIIFKRHYRNFIKTNSLLSKGLCFCMIYCILASYMASYFHFSTILTFMLCYVTSLKKVN